MILKRPTATLTLLFYLIGPTIIAIENLSSGARSLGLSNANVTLQDIWSANNNQAGLAFVEQFGFGFSYENRFGLSELSIKNLNAAIPFKLGTFGVTIQQFGYSDYSEYKFGIGYGLKVSKHISIGAQIDYLLVSISESQTQNKSGVTAEIGLLADLTKNLKMGFHMYNLPNTKLSGDYGEHIPMILKLGLNYNFSKKLLTIFEIQKNIDLNPEIKIGVEYHPIEQLFFRGGINAPTSSSTDVQFSAGIGIKLQQFTLDLAFNHQSYIGYISQISLSYSLVKKAN